MLLAKTGNARMLIFEKLIRRETSEIAEAEVCYLSGVLFHVAFILHNLRIKTSFKSFHTIPSYKQIATLLLDTASEAL